MQRSVARLVLLVDLIGYVFPPFFGAPFLATLVYKMGGIALFFLGLPAIPRTPPRKISTPRNSSTSRNTSLPIHPFLPNYRTHPVFAQLALIMSHKRVLSDPAIEGPPSPKRPNFTTFARRTFGQRGPTITATIPPIHIPESTSAAAGSVGTWSNTRKQVIELATHLHLTFPEEVLDAILMIESYARHVKRTPSSKPQAYASERATWDTISSSRANSSDGRARGMENNARDSSPGVFLCQLYSSSALASGGLRCRYDPIWLLQLMNQKNLEIIARCRGGYRLL